MPFPHFHHQSAVHDMTEGNISKQLLYFALPLMLGNVFQMLYNTVDSIVVGNFVSSQALAAIGSTTMITNMAVFFFNGFSIGAGVVIGNLFGARDLKRLHQAVETIIASTFILCIAFTLLGVLGTDSLLHFMKTPADVYDEASLYLQIYFAGVSGLLLYNMGSAILRSVGDTSRPLYFLILSSLLNIILDLLLVLGFGWGIAGAAWATVISQFVSALIILLLLTRTHEIYRFVWSDMHIDPHIFWDVLRIGLPTAFQAMITSLSNIFVQAYINFFGSTVMAGYACYNKLNSFVMLPMSSMAMAATTFVSQNSGAQKHDRVLSGTRKAILITLLMTALLCSFLFVLAPQAVGLFSPDSAVIDSGISFVRFLVYFLLFNCVNHVLAGSLRGRGDSTGPMLCMLLCFVLLRQIYLALVTTYVANTPLIVGFGYPLGWMTCCLLELLYYRFRWANKRI